MKRTGRRFTEDFLEENNEEIVYEDFELKDEKAPEEEYQYFDFSEDDFSEEIAETEEQDEAKKPSFLKNLAKILIVILVLIALFFASAKVTELILDHNEEPVSFEDDTPDFDEDFDGIIDESEPPVDNDIPEVLGNEEITEYKPESKPEEEKPEEDKKPEAEKPESNSPVTPAPEPKPEPAPAPAPSPAPTPSIKPGNPAA